MMSLWLRFLLVLAPLTVPGGSGGGCGETIFTEIPAARAPVSNGMPTPEFAEEPRLPGKQHSIPRRGFHDLLKRCLDSHLAWKILTAASGTLLLVALRYRWVAKYNRALHSMNRELEDSLEEYNRIISVISHDLRQPIHGYNQTLALLQTGVVDPNDTTGQRILAQSRQRGEQAIESMENLLDWLRKDSIIGVHHPTLLSPRRIAEDCRELLAASLEQKKLILKNSIPPELRLHADERRLSSILRNLINNAIKFSEQGGKIHVEGSLRNGSIRLKIRDEGVGMPAETIEEILTGKTVPSTRGTGGEKGSGMGLRLCRLLLADMGSELEIESSPGRGSVFSFTLGNGQMQKICRKTKPSGQESAASS